MRVLRRLVFTALDDAGVSSLAVCLFGGLVIGAAGLGLMEPRSAAAQPLPFDGAYVCRGTNPDGESYAQPIVVEPTGEDGLYRVQWADSMGLSAVGQGLLQDGRFAVAYLSRSSAIGLVVYQVEAGRLIGQWTILGVPGAYGETCSRGDEL